MCDERDQMLEDFKEFISMLDFDLKEEEGTVYIIPNMFKLNELPATIQSYILSYTEYIKSIC